MKKNDNDSISAIKYTKDIIDEVPIICYTPVDKNVENVLIVVHGFGGDKFSSNATVLADILPNFNCAVISFDLHCHGDRDTREQLNLKRCIRDVEIVCNYAKQKFMNAELSILGKSFGGYLTMCLLNKNQICFKHCILDVPAINMDKIIADIASLNKFNIDDNIIVNCGNQTYPLYVGTDFYREFVEYNLCQNFNAKNFLYIFLAEKDEIVDTCMVEQYFKKRGNCEIKVFENADHNFSNIEHFNCFISNVVSIMLK